LSFLSAIMGLTFAGVASAAYITIYYSPSCPHCDHAREFISNTLVYEYPELKVTAVNVMDQAILPAFQDALKKCEFDNGGVPVMVIGDKCEQGYADFMQDTMREYIEVDLSDEQKAVAAENKAAMAADAEKFKSEHADRANAVVEYTATVAEPAAEPVAESEKKNEGGSTVWFWGLLIVLVATLGYVLVRKDNKK
ncbi:MAG: hypothetical protein KIG73_00605, partial [Alphaproteobacteria bacterium]|nr:hypothetical protein [Alphaproteobacteria bacterium]